ncbi:cuticle protein 1 [Schistocerca gregaria]|uniref:cuticle protein 1 n=1 Tax=Schistocerca gregaria TaxID=7010 RepID=UPI00211F0733|nr:cuticle protein 1 [Schistocerca gregaria]
MLRTLVLVALCAWAVAAQDRYPAGLSAALCPNYPLCDNSVIATFSSPAGVPAARSYPAGVAAAACPNYPYCNNNVYPGYAAPREYPTGVHPAACPGYPFC